VIALFGEAEKGEYKTAYYCETLPQLEECLGEPPCESRGLHYAVQALLYRKGLIFFRVKEEGYSLEDYLLGLNFLKNRQLVPSLTAICMPGVGDPEVIEATAPICDQRKSLLIVSECDLYDYLTSFSC
jgi:hypothetical protein